MKNYHFSCGNSTRGSVGLCARIAANSKQDALRKLRRVLSDNVGASGEVSLAVADRAVEYVNFYISPENIYLADIDED